MLNDDHVCLIKNIKEYYRKFIHRNKKISHICQRCLTIFEEEGDCNNHSLQCSAQTTIEYAQPGEHLGFQKFKALYPHPYVCFANFEYLNKKFDVNNKNTQQVATQHAFAYKYSIINIIDKENQSITKEKAYYGNDCVNNKGLEKDIFKIKFPHQFLSER